ncbi:hypothetical protein B0A55_09759 [Friedmanniomyces simplex]|uniref:Heterokaryon incompatibility domain-containing protein n=1 Tax=Friedmanniomyces simplex TaxID=329884 RepID=A0A4U0WQJ8_9PEZI|nr:hypothetical protein B0A55_09759 [Friedmanniomyces simplex]
MPVLRRPWYSRRWVIQEAYHKAPRNRYICIGGYAIRGDRLERALLEMNLLRRAPALERAELRQRSLLQNLQVYHMTKCADPRDRIYAPLSISRQLEPLAVDYGIWEEELYFSFAKARVSVALLVSAASRNAMRLGSLGALPFWISDWQAGARHRSVFHEDRVMESLALTEKSDGYRLHPSRAGLLVIHARLLTPYLQA